MTECNHLPPRTVPAQREQLCAMLATLAHEQHQPVVLSGDEAMGAAKLPRCVYDRGRHSHVRLQVTTVARFIIGSAAEAIAVPPIRTEKTKSNSPPSGLRLQCCHRITEWVFNRARV